MSDNATAYQNCFNFLSSLRPPRGVCEARLHQSYKPCVIGAIPSQTYGIYVGGLLDLALGAGEPHLLH